LTFGELKPFGSAQKIVATPLHVELYLTDAKTASLVVRQTGVEQHVISTTIRNNVDLHYTGVGNVVSIAIIARRIIK
jgi:hypothetical protein